MRALQFRAFGGPPEVVDVPRPKPRAGEILLRVTAAGICASDSYIMNLPPEEYLQRYPLPLTLGHEGVGDVVELGEGVSDFSIGDSVAVYGPWGCGHCRNCALGNENYCVTGKERRKPRPGMIAEYALIDAARRLVPLGGLDPVASVALTDAGLTPYHAIKRSLPRIHAGATAVVIGVGGLGHVAIQILRALTPATVIALDVHPEKLLLAKQVGAHFTIPSDKDSVQHIRNITRGQGVDAVFDVVGSPSTVALAGQASALDGEISILGLAGGALPVGMHTTAPGVSVRAPYWGSKPELIEVLELARAGLIRVETVVFDLESAPSALELLAAGRVHGRAVVTP